MPEQTTNETQRRRYASPVRAKRAQETRAALLSAAAELFSTKGWKGTGMRDVAAGGGVAIETLYSHFASKRVLLQAVIDVAVVGDDVAVPVAGREAFTRLAQGPRTERLAAAAALVRGINERTAPYAVVLREAAPGDEQIAEHLRATRERQHSDVEAGLTLILGRPPTKSEADEVWALLSPEVYLLLVDDAGWTPSGYESWIVSMLDRVLPAT